jgi:hypothetical protein
MQDDLETTHPNRSTIRRSPTQEVRMANRTDVGQAEAALLTGIAVCAFCGQQVESDLVSPGQVAYRCRADGQRAHLVRSAPPVDAWLRQLVIDRLARHDAGHLVADTDGSDLYELRAHSGGLRARRSQVADAVADGTVDGSQGAASAAYLDGELAAVEQQMVEHAERDLPASLTGADPIEIAWDRLSAAQQRAVLHRIAERVALHPVPPGGRAGDSGVLRNTVIVTWRTA